MMMAPSPNRELNFFLPLIVIFLLCCCAIPTILNLERFSLLQVQDRVYLLAVIAFVVVESAISRRIYQKREITELDLFLNQIGELVILILLSKLGSYWNSGWRVLSQDLKSWVDHPHLILQGTTIPLIFFVLVAWRSSSKILISLDFLSQSPKILDFFTSQERTEAHAVIQQALFLGGIWVLIMAGANLALDHYYMMEKQVSSLMQFGVIGYFLAALILLGYTHYLKKRQEWEQGEVPIPQGLNYRWLAGGIGLSSLVLLVSGVLPAVSTVAPEVLVNLANKVLGFFVQMAIVIHLLLYTLLYWIAKLLPFAPSPGKLPEPKFNPVFFQEDPGQEIQIPSFLIWELIVLILIVIASLYFRTRAWPSGTWREKIKSWFQALWYWLIYLKTMQETLLNLVSVKKEKKKATDNLTLQKREGLFAQRTPNARIRRHYLALLRSTEKSKYQRRHQQTPKEYETFLASHWPQSKEELDTLTETFILARYRAEDCDSNDLIQVQQAWKKLRRELVKYKDSPKD